MPSGPPVHARPAHESLGVSRLVMKPFSGRADRPTFRRSCLPDSFAPPSSTIRPPRGVPDAWKAMVQGLAQENAGLWSERESDQTPGGSFQVEVDFNNPGVVACTVKDRSGH